MDINELPFEDHLRKDFMYDLSLCHYAIYLCPPTVNLSEESFAVAILAPDYTDNGATLKMYNAMKGTYAQGYLVNIIEARKRFLALQHMLSNKENYKLVWEGKIHGLQRSRTIFESSWTN